MLDHLLPAVVHLEHNSGTNCFVVGLRHNEADVKEVSFNPGRSVVILNCSRPKVLAVSYMSALT